MIFRIKLATSLIFLGLFGAFTKDNNVTPSVDIGSIPKGEFGSPVLHAIELSANFAELRPNHFHGGLDIRASKRGVDGDPILSIGDGYISQIKVSGRGYGNCLHISHPNGYTSVYAHLDKFSAELTKYIYAIQESSKSFEQDMLLNPNLFPIRKGDIIGEMGNTGHSFGTHLHFEIRKTDGDILVNPLHFGYYIADSRPPKASVLRVYSLDEKGEEVSVKNYNLSKTAGGGYFVKEAVVVDSDYAAFAINADDEIDNSSNTMGVYNIQGKENDQEVFAFKLDGVPFADTRYLNAHIDYDYAASRAKIHRCFKLPNNRLGIYKAENNGIIHTDSLNPKSMIINFGDYSGNSSSIGFSLNRSRYSAPAPYRGYHYVIEHSKPYVIKTNDFEAHFDDNTFYETMYLNYSNSYDYNEGAYSQIHTLGTTNQAVHDYFTVKIKPTNLPPDLANKVILINCSGKKENNGGEWDGEFFKARVRRLGNYCLVADLNAPKIKASFNSSEKKPFSGKTLRFSISDDLSGIEKYELYLDNSWVLLSHDAKSGSYKAEIPDFIGSGQHSIRLEATDKKGNQNFFTEDLWMR